MKTNIITFFASLLLISLISCKEKDLTPPADPLADPPPDSTNVTLLAEDSSGPDWSPKGKEITYIYDYYSLYLMDSDGSNKRELSTDIYEQPIWSPSGDYILYIGHSPSTQWELIRVDANGDNKTILCGGNTEPRLASWSPDGQKIVFTTWNGILSVINSDGTNLHDLTDNVNTPEIPRWSPDMNTILFTKGADYERDMYFINSDGSNLTRLPIDSLYETNVRFSIDGTKVFFTAYPIFGNHNIYSVNCDGSEFINLTSDMNYGGSFQISPDGTKIAFSGSYADEGSNLYIMATDGSGKQLVTGVGAGQKSWSPDGKEIAFTSSLNYKPSIYSIRVDQ